MRPPTNEEREVLKRVAWWLHDHPNPPARAGIAGLLHDLAQPGVSLERTIAAFAGTNALLLLEQWAREEPDGPDYRGAAAIVRGVLGSPPQ